MLEVSFWPPAKDLAEFFGVHISTARRWRREQNAPPAVIMLLSQDLGVFDAKARGWCIRNGCLISPEQLVIPLAKVLSIPFMDAQITNLQRDIKEMRVYRDTGLENQPEPVEWDLARVLAG